MTTKGARSHSILVYFANSEDFLASDFRIGVVLCLVVCAKLIVNSDLLRSFSNKCILMCLVDFGDVDFEAQVEVADIDLRSYGSDLRFLDNVRRH